MFRSKSAGLPEFVSPSRAFHLGDAPNIDLGDHAGQRYRSNLYRRLKNTRTGKSGEVASFRDGGSQPYIGAMQHLDLSADEAAALIKELQEITGNDRYQFSPRIRTLKAILAKLRPEPLREPLPAPKGYTPR